MMGCVYKRGKNYTAKWTDHEGNTVRKSTGTSDKASALKIMRKWEQRDADIRAGLINPAMLAIADHRRRPIDEHRRAWLDDHGMQIKANTRREYVRHLDRFLGEFGGQDDETVARRQPAKTIADITAERMRAYMRWRVVDGGHSHADANRAFQAIRAWMQWCEDSGRVDRNPLKGVKKLDESKRINKRRIRREYTIPELEMLMRVGQRVDQEWTRPSDGRAHADQPRRYAQYMVAYYMGFRRGDLERLTWDCVRLGVEGEGGSITMERKSGRRWTGAIVAPLEPVLRSLLPAMTLPGAMRGQRVFARIVTMAELRADQRRGRAWHIRAGKTKIERRERRRGTFLADNQYGVLDLHSLRHACGTHLAMTNIPPKALQEHMDHSDIRTTMSFYAHARVDQTAEHLNRAMGQGLGDAVNGQGLSGA
jgi:site-specific recombinase XerD